MHLSAIRNNFTWFHIIKCLATGSLKNIGLSLSDAKLTSSARDSRTSTEFYNNYSRLISAMYSMVNIMIVDWNAADICMTDRQNHEKYLSGVFSNGVTSKWVTFGNLLKDENFTSTGLTLLSAPDIVEINYKKSYACSDNIRNLDSLYSALSSLEDSVSNYKNALKLFTSDCSKMCGRGSEAMKCYFEQMHSPMIEASLTIISEFTDYIRQYQALYFDRMPEEQYVYELDDLLDLQMGLERTERNIRDKFNEINAFISACQEDVPLNLLSTGNMESFCDNTHGDIEVLREIVLIIRENEKQGSGYCSDLKFEIMKLQHAASSMGRNPGMRVLAYREGDYKRIIADDLRWIKKDEKSEDPRPEEVQVIKDLNRENLELLLNGTDEQKEAAREYFRNNITGNMVDSLKDHRDDYYDSDVFPGKLDNVDFYDSSLIEEFRSIYDNMQEFGFIKEDAIKYAEIALLYNPDGVRNPEVNATDAVLQGIRNYAADFSLHVANDSRYGYDQWNRWCQDIDNKGMDFDCSSLVVTAYEKAGVPMNGVADNLATNAMKNWAMNYYGFSTYTTNQDIYLDDMVVGDVILVDVQGTKIGHTEIYIGHDGDDYRTVSGHGSELVHGEIDGTYTGWKYEDELQINGVEGLIDENTDFPRWYHDKEFGESPENKNGEEGPYIVDDERGTDKDGNDRIGEIRVECINGGDGRIEPYSEDYDFQVVYRLERLDVIRDRLAESRNN